jgi:hypothetical protein
MVVAAGSRESAPLEPIHRAPKASPPAGSPDRPPLHLRERNSSMKNRKRESCISGTVRDEDGNILIYSADFVNLDSLPWAARLAFAGLKSPTMSARLKLGEKRPQERLVDAPASNRFVVDRLAHLHCARSRHRPLSLVKGKTALIPVKTAMGNDAPRLTF